MRQILLLTILVMAFFSFQADAAITRCGDDSSDRQFSRLNWEQAASYKVNTSFANISAIVCVGIDYANLEIKRLHYRDNTGMKRNYYIRDLKKRDTVLLKRSDFPAAARLVTRNVDPLTIRVTADTKYSSYRKYALSFKFVRNMAKGWSALDTRELPVYAKVRNHAYSPLDVYYASRSGNTSFDHLALNLAGSLKIESIDLSMNSRKVKNIKSATLKRVNRK